MTYGVPYSFVPGTKARADEVNANFIDVLNKISETNTRVDNSNSSINTELANLDTKIEEVNASKVDLSLSNINSTAKALFDAKANTSQLDGTWTIKYSALCSEKSISPDETHTYSLSSYLPDKTNKYEIIASGYTNTQESSNSTNFSVIQTDLITSKMIMFQAVTRNNSQGYDTFQNVLLSSTGRTITVYCGSASVNTSKYSLRLHAYRKVS